jgi:glycosyltransferase involved in cell wall biosynthesis
MEIVVRIALIIPTVGRPDDLDACLQSIDREANPNLAQVIVIDDGAAEPVTVPSHLAGVAVCCLRNPEQRGAAYSRNRALAALAADVDAVGFIDDDARLCPGWLDTASRELTRDRGAITGPVRRFDRGLVSRARQLRYERRYASLEPGQAVDFLAGGNSVVWRDLLERAGGFPDVRTMSDRLLVRRLEAQGRRCHFVPELYVLHRNSKGLRVAVREAWRAGLLDDTPQKTPALARLATGAHEAITGPHIVTAVLQTAAALLNVGLDSVYLMGRTWSRSQRTGAQAREPGTGAPPESQRAS